MTQFSEFTDLCIKIESIPGSLEMTDVFAEFLKSVDDDELAVSCYMVMGEIFPAWTGKKLGLGPNLLYSALSKAAGISLDKIKALLRETGDVGETTYKALCEDKKSQSTFSSFFEAEDKSSDDSSDGNSDGSRGLCNSGGRLSIREVYDRLKEIADASGKGAQSQKIKSLQYLFSESSPIESKYIARIALEELRIGIGEGIVRDSIAKAFDVPVAQVEFAFMVTNDLGEVAVAAKKGGSDALVHQNIQVGRPVKMMLAQVTTGIETAFAELDEAAIEWKFDGARLQIHKSGSDIQLFTRRLENVTNSMPDVVKAVTEAVTAENAVLDGEAVAIDENGNPRPFQDILRRFRRKYDVETTSRDIPIHVNLFDLLYADGVSYIEKPLTERRAKLSEIVKPNAKGISVDELKITKDPETANEMYQAALAAGHEGIMIKNPNSPYSPGKRGKNWLKKKPVMDTLDLVVIGGEWGSGKRKNKIGSYVLACYDNIKNVNLEIGRVGTGLSDELLDTLTEQFKDLIEAENGVMLKIKPEVVFEIAFEEIQKSPNYPAGYALRFPRLVRVREDKTIEEIDTIEKIDRMYQGQKE
ncbi:DNA ligase [Methanimicrococcus hongohii]|uniref:DNA ligase n=1 Tax=Methanimicrococcus hongohii TaxID=3028295 RepID=A0AA97A2V4_9EURY|nr:ATP-dependent DNA ligase [Methanimicrococcus sp. Hf6]WNY24428.1 DNA ligase [Methanimicrococcus sp. Hf6]